MVVVEEGKSVKRDLSKMKVNRCSLMINLQLMRKLLAQVRRELNEKYVLIESSREDGKARKSGGGR